MNYSLATGTDDHELGACTVVLTAKPLNIMYSIVSSVDEELYQFVLQMSIQRRLIRLQISGQLKRYSCVLLLLFLLFSEIGMSAYGLSKLALF